MIAALLRLLPVHAHSSVAKLAREVDRLAACLAETCQSGDALVNNAGVADFAPRAETDFARWCRVMETSLDSVFLMSQALCAPPVATRSRSTATAPRTGWPR